MVIPKVNIPNLKRLACHHFNVNVLNIFMRDRRSLISITHFRVKLIRS
jgi:hypothetical protein